MHLKTAMTAPDPSTAMVALEGVTKRFGATTAVDGASFTLEAGAFLTIVGPSGCGKTTLLRMIAGFERPTEGRIALAGQDVSKTPAHARAVGMVFQKLALFPHMTAADNIAYPLRRRGTPKAEIAARVDEMLALVRLPGLGARRPHELSGGQQQRVAIARALSFRPNLLLLDEPLSALDKKLREDMQLEFRRIQQELGVTTINVTHDQREALVMSDRIVVMNEGRIQQTATPQTLYGAPQNPFVATFIGLTTMFPGTVRTGDPLTVDAGSLTLRARGDGAPGAAVDCAIRAEHVTVSETPLTADNALTGTVTDAVFEGERSTLIVAVSGLPPLSAFHHGPPPAPGTAVHVGFDAKHLLTFAKETP
ncbi:MAG: ABC transporter ATP-binding protein [Pseudomonadota bacterium]